MEGKFGPLPYYLFYYRQFRASSKVQSMGYVQRGLYRELLDECWDKGYIPDNIKELAKICHCPPSRFAKAWPKLSKCFVPLETGRLGSERMLKETERVSNVIAARSKGGRKGGLQRVENIKQRSSTSVAFASRPEAYASSRVEKEYIDKSIYSLKANASNRKNQNQNQNHKTFSDPGVACVQCGKALGLPDSNAAPDDVYVCSRDCLAAYERKATSSATEAG